jgi:hypothetical protein
MVITCFLFIYLFIYYFHSLFFFFPLFSLFYFPLLYIHGFTISTSPLPSEHAAVGDASPTRASAHGVNCVGVHIAVVAVPAKGTRLSIMALDIARDGECLLRVV